MNLAQSFDRNFSYGRHRIPAISIRDGVRVELFARPERCSASSRRPCGNWLARRFGDVNFLLRTGHLEGWAAVLDDPAASANDRFVAAAPAEKRRTFGRRRSAALPGHRHRHGRRLSRGNRCSPAATTRRNSKPASAKPTPRGTCGFRKPRRFRCSRSGTRAIICPPRSTFTRLPGEEYQFLFVAKGGGSSNKTSLFQETKALLNEESFTKFLREKVRALGVAACPPYHLGLVVGGTSPEFNLKMLKLATTGALDHLPDEADGRGEPYRDRLWESRLLEIAAETGLGAQFGGKYLALSARVIRCAGTAEAARCRWAFRAARIATLWRRISAEGIFLEEFDRNPARFLPKALAVLQQAGSARRRRRSISTGRSAEVCRSLSRYPVGNDGAALRAR